MALNTPADNSDRSPAPKTLHERAAEMARTSPANSEERYRRLTEAVTDYVYRVRVEHSQAVDTEHGANCQTVTGYTPQEFAANRMLWIEMVPPEDRAIVEQQAARILSSQDAAPIEHRIRRKDGQTRWMVSTVSPQHDDQGRLIAYDGLLRDITERRQAEEALRQLNEELEERVSARTADLRRRTDQLAEQSAELEKREREFRTLADNVPALFAYVDHEQRYRYVNRRYEELFRQPATDIVGKSVSELLGPHRLEVVRPYVEAALRGEEVTYEAEFDFADGKHVMHVTYVPDLQEQGQVQGFFTLITDISDRKRAEAALREREERLRAILNTAADAIITIDRRGIIDHVNPATEKVFGYTRDELVGQNVKMLMPPPYRDEHDGYLSRYLETGQARIIGIGRELVGRRKDGSTFPADAAVSEISELGLFTGVIRDISDRKELQKQVLEIAAEEDRRIGHELHEGIQQEVTAMELFAGTLRDAIDAAERKEVEGKAIRLLQEAGFLQLRDTAEKLCKGLAETHAHVQQLSRGIMPVQVDAHGLNSAIAELASSTDALQDITCRFESAEVVEVADNTTATHLYRIAQEAVNNSLRHSQGDQIRIWLARQDDQIILEVSDNGVGIDPTISSGAGIAGGPKGIGLRAMHYRAGLIGATLRIGRIQEGGTLVRCTVRRGG